MKKVLYICNIPSPYRVRYFEELGKYCKLTVLYEKRLDSERHNKWKYESDVQTFKSVFLNSVFASSGNAFCPDVITYIRQPYDIIICCDFLSLTGMHAVTYMKRHRIKYYLESDGGFAGNGKGIKEFVKRRIITGAEGYFSTGQNHDEYYLKYGAEKSKIIRYPFSSICDGDLLGSIISDKQPFKSELMVEEQYMVLAVGQFIYRKGFDVLLKAAKSIDDSVGLYFVGGEPNEEYIRLAEGNPHIHFEGFKSKSELDQYYYAADIFVLPTREDIWGLVINEAMAKGLPVITTDKCAAGLAMIENGENGFIIDVDNNADMIAEKINMLMTNDEFRNRVAMNSLLTGKQYTIERMVDAHRSVLFDNFEDVVNDKNFCSK